YRHGGGEGPSDAFSFTAADGDGATVGGTFALTVTPVNDPPAVAPNGGLTVAEGGQATIRDLVAADPDDTRLTWTVTSAPTRGTILRDGVPAATFTQAELNAGRIAYAHD